MSNLTYSDGFNQSSDRGTHSYSIQFFSVFFVQVFFFSRSFRIQFWNFQMAESLFTNESANAFNISKTMAMNKMPGENK